MTHRVYRFVEKDNKYDLCRIAATHRHTDKRFVSFTWEYDKG
jgi:hypothetical protein